MNDPAGVGFFRNARVTAIKKIKRAVDGTPDRPLGRRRYIASRLESRIDDGC